MEEIKYKVQKNSDGNALLLKNDNYHLYSVKRTSSLTLSNFGRSYRKPA